MAESHYQVLARKWRPQRFDDVVGQDHITRTLKNAIESGRIHHAFLFIGSRGIGKTTTARILAKALNCLSSESPTTTPCGTCSNCESIGAGNNIDVIEIDGASNNGVDDVREIRDNIRMVPTHGRYKVYIIDEVHQLSIGAFNALLKTLEEPPQHAIFVLATTEAHKIPATIVSRCQRYDFRRVGADAIVQLLRGILDKEELAATDEALYAIARAAEGGVRDSESILDELITYCEGEITFQDVFDVLGLVNWDVLHGVCDAILEKDVARLLVIVEEVVAGGKDLSQFVQEILRYFRNLLVARTANAADLLHLPEEEVAAIRARAQRFSLTNLIRLVEQFAELTSGFDSQLAQRIALEAMLIRVSKASVELSVDVVLEKLLQLGQGGIALGASEAPVSPTAPPTPETPAPPARAAAPPPPENPPEAGPVEEAPAAPVEERRLAFQPESLREDWESLVALIGREKLNLGVWMGQARPDRIEEGAIILHFPGEADQARAIVEKPEHRQAVEALLEAHTEHLRSFRTEFVATPESAPGKAPVAVAKEGPWYASVNPEEAKAALEDPGLAEVIEFFKGRIAEIKPPPPSSDEPGMA